MALKVRFRGEANETEVLLELFGSVVSLVWNGAHVGTVQGSSWHKIGCSMTLIIATLVSLLWVIYTFKAMITLKDGRWGLLAFGRNSGLCVFRFFGELHQDPCFPSTVSTVCMYCNQCDQLFVELTTQHNSYCTAAYGAHKHDRPASFDLLGSLKSGYPRD